MGRLLALLLIVSLCPVCAKRKKTEEELTQQLEVPKDPPLAVVAEASRMVWFVSPLSGKGLLSQQIRDGLKALMSQTKGAQIVKIRAFVAGSGDLRRVPAMASEIFTEKKQAIPAVSVVQVGALPLVGAQVQLEAIAVDRKPVNPQGLAFISGQAGPVKDAAQRLAGALTPAGVQPDTVRHVTCFVDSLDFEADLRRQLATTFPKAPIVISQLRRDSGGDFSECEAAAALGKAPAKSPQMVDANDRYSQASLVGPVKLALTGIQMAFGREEKDVKLALDRMGKALEGFGATWKTVAMNSNYLLTGSVREPFRNARRSLINPAEPPASTTLLFEGLPSLDASLAVEAIAVSNR